MGFAMLVIVAAELHAIVAVERHNADLEPAVVYVEAREHGMATAAGAASWQNGRAKATDAASVSAVDPLAPHTQAAASSTHPQEMDARMLQIFPDTAAVHVWCRAQQAPCQATCAQRFVEGASLSHNP